MPYYIRPEDPTGTVFDPYDHTFGPIMSALSTGNFELAAALTRRLTDSEPLSISFNGEASEAFADWIAQREGWYVRITPREGEPFDAVLKGSAAMGWYDGVYFTRPDEDGLEIEGAPIEHTRVSDVYVY